MSRLFTPGGQSIGSSASVLPLNIQDSLLNGHEFEQILGDSEGQGSLACHGVTESDTT